MDNLPERLQKLMQYYGLNAGELAARLGIQKSSVSHLLSGRNKPSFLFLSKLVKAFPEINLKWFITGQGKITESEKEVPKEQKDVKVKTSETQKTLPSAEPIPAKSNTDIENIIMVYGDDTFKILQKRKETIR